MHRLTQRLAWKVSNTIYRPVLHKNKCQNNIVNSDMPRTQFEFICVSGTNIRGDAATRKRVRSRAQADYRRRQNPAPKPTLHQEFDVAEWVRVVSQENAITSKPSSNATAKTISKIPSSPRGSASHVPFASDQSNPFALMAPAQLKRARLLWAHCKCR